MDEDVAELLQGTAGDPERIRAKVRHRRRPGPSAPRLADPLAMRAPDKRSAAPQGGMGSDCRPPPPAPPRMCPLDAQMEAQLQRRELIREGSGVEAPPSVLFREVDQFDMWVRGGQRGGMRAPASGQGPGLRMCAAEAHGAPCRRRMREAAPP